MIADFKNSIEGLEIKLKKSSRKLDIWTEEGEKNKKSSETKRHSRKRKQRINQITSRKPPKLKDMSFHLERNHQVPSKINDNKPTPRYIIITFKTRKMTRDK